jgi:hypothetical protein
MCLQPGTYYFFVGPQFNDTVECPSDYVVSFVCDECPPPPPGGACSTAWDVALPADLPYADMGATNCCLWEWCDDTCLGYYDGGDDSFYKLTVASGVGVEVTLDPLGTTYTGVLLDDACCPDAECLGFSTSYSAIAHGIPCTYLPPGEYYVMVDTWPSPQCIPAYNLTINECVVPTGACCVEGECVATNYQTECMALGGFWYEGEDCATFVCPLCHDTEVTLGLADLPYVDVNSTCGANDDWEDTCLGSYDGGDDFIYKLVVTETMTVDIVVSGAISWTGLALDDACPPGASCLAYATAYSGEVSISQYTLDPGTYYVMVDSWPSPQCQDFTLTIEAYEECVIECPPGGVDEGEPCGDDTNGGCNMDTPVFEALDCDSTKCGTYWADASLRDTDWYEVVTTVDTIFTMDLVGGEFPLGTVFGLIEQTVPGVPGCDNTTGYLNPYAFPLECDPATVVTDCMPAGTYYFFVTTGGWGDYPCTMDYAFSLTCEPCSTPTGACCDAGTCMPDMTEADCLASYAGPWFEGVGCDPNPCPIPPANDDCADAEYLGDTYPVSVTFDNSLATDDITTPCGVYSGPWKNVWYTVMGTGNTMTATTCTAGTVVSDTKISVFTSCDNADCVTGNDDDCDEYGSYLSTVSWCSEVDVLYYITAGTFSSSTTPGVIQLDVTDDGVPCGGPGYCAATGGCDEYISGVTVGTIANTGTLCDNYTDYSGSLSTAMVIGTDYTITVDNGYAYTGDICGVWVDWDGDLDWYDETMITMSGGPIQFTGTVTPPAGAVGGKMRVRIQYGGTLDPCGTTAYGEVEDYGVTITTAGGTAGDWDDDDGDTVPNVCDNCPTVPNTGQEDTDGDGFGDACDECPDDPLKSVPGQCGCGEGPMDGFDQETDTDGDGTADCIDGCPNDPNKIAPGICGCGVPDTDTDGDGTPDCIDECPNDPNKIVPGVCGCGVPDTDSDGDTIPDCIDQCPGEDDLADVNRNGIPDCLEPDFIPAVSTWGLVVLALLLLTGAKVYFGRRQRRMA